MGEKRNMQNKNWREQIQGKTKIGGKKGEIKNRGNPKQGKTKI